MLTRRLALAIAVLVALTLAPTASALKPGVYKGKTKQGQKVTFKVKHNRIRKIKSYVNALCVKYGGDYSQTFEGHRYLPPGSWKVKSNGRIDPKQHKQGRFRYVVKGKTKGRRKVKGQLQLHYEREYFTGTTTYFTFCTVETPFSARWKKAG
jgi:hypothetical protein